jgi:hypothetical protein
VILVCGSMSLRWGHSSDGVFRAPAQGPVDRTLNGFPSLGAGLTF